jgi:hypothetical protein
MYLVLYVLSIKFCAQSLYHGYLIFQSGRATEKSSQSSSECEPQGLKLPEPLKADKMMIFDPTNVAANLNFHAG